MLESKRQKRAFHRLLSGIKVGNFSNVPVSHLVLTSAPGTDYKDLNRSWEIFRKRAVRRWGRFAYCKIKTRGNNGFGHLHVLVRSRRMLPQKWISENWSEARKGSFIVFIKRLYGSARKGAGYLAAQYCSGQAGFDRLSMSQDWISVGFPKKWKWVLWKSGVVSGSYPTFETDLSRLPVAFELWDSYLRQVVAEREQAVLEC